MCLDAITRRYPGKSKKVLRAWKVLTWRYGQLTFPVNNGQPLLTDTWMRAAFEFPAGPCDDPYVTGFHVFASQRDALNWRLYGDYNSPDIVDIAVPVLVRGITYKGKEGQTTVFVAREMYVPSPRKAKK